MVGNVSKQTSARPHTPILYTWFAVAGACKRYYRVNSLT